MSIKTKLSAIFLILVSLILILNNFLSYYSTRELLIKDITLQMQTLAKQIAIAIENSKQGSQYIEDLMGEKLRLAAIAAENELDPDIEKVSDEQLVSLSEKLGIAHITLMKQMEGDIKGIKSSDPAERGLSTKDWGFWFDAFRQLLARERVTVKEGKALSDYWSGPSGVSSSDPDHIDKWGYYYDGKTNYIINPYIRDQQVLDYTHNLGPEAIVAKSRKTNGVLDITGFNPSTFGLPTKYTVHNGTKYIDLLDKDIQFGEYKYKNEQIDIGKVRQAQADGGPVSYITTIDGTKVLKTFIPVSDQNPYVIGLVTDYSIIQSVLNRHMLNNGITSFSVLIIVVIVSFIMASYIVRPVNRILRTVNEIADGNFGAQLDVHSKDELGVLSSRVNMMSQNLETYTRELEQKKAEVEYHAYHDFLTGLPNRRYFNEQSQLALELAHRTDKPLAVMFMDLDRFKFINDVFGHSAGDIMLQSVAIRLLLQLKGASASRIGGDEFVVILPDTDREAAAQKAQEMLDVISQPYEYEGNELFVTPSLGISMYPSDGKSMETLMKNADRAMYRAKEQGRNNYQFFSEDMQDLISKRVALEKSLRKALDKGELQLHYQPQFCLETGVIVGCEALLRWYHKDIGLVAPAEFIPLAEETGLIVPIGEWVIRTACMQNKRWQEAGFPPIRIAVNLSARQFQQQNLVEGIVSILKETKLEPHYLELEITESIAMYNEDYVIQKLHELKNIGIYISIDDFGSGYSSLNYLKKFPINTLKVDRSFLTDIAVESDNREIITTIIAMARNLKVGVVAEGVETIEQLQFLKQHQCQVAQGFLLSLPLPVEQFEETFRGIQEAATAKIMSYTGKSD